MTGVTVYTRRECHLCVEVIEALRALHSEGYAFEIHEIDIESQEILLRRFLEEIPVVEINDVVVSKFAFDENAIRTALDCR